MNVQLINPAALIAMLTSSHGSGGRDKVLWWKLRARVAEEIRNHGLQRLAASAPPTGCGWWRRLRHLGGSSACAVAGACRAERRSSSAVILDLPGIATGRCQRRGELRYLLQCEGTLCNATCFFQQKVCSTKRQTTHTTSERLTPRREEASMHRLKAEADGSDSSD